MRIWSLGHKEFEVARHWCILTCILRFWLVNFFPQPQSLSRTTLAHQSCRCVVRCVRCVIHTKTIPRVHQKNSMTVNPKWYHVFIAVYEKSNGHTWVGLVVTICLITMIEKSLTSLRKGSFVRFQLLARFRSAQIRLYSLPYVVWFSSLLEKENCLYKYPFYINLSSK